MIHVGIDVGGKGGIFAMTDKGKIIVKEAIPTIKGSTKVDYKKLVEILRSLKHLEPELSTRYLTSEKIVVVIEDVHSLFGMSAKSNFSFGLIKGVKLGILESLGYEYHLVHPKTWQKEIWIEEDIVMNDKKKDTKATSLSAATRLFTEVDFTKSVRAYMPHDGIVDAALMAEYCKRKFKKQT